MEEKYKIPIIEGYGLSETSPVVSFNHLHKGRKAGSIGTPIWGIEVKIFDEDDKELPPEEVGELVTRGHCVMKGYYNKPEETAEAYKGTSWFHTGDLAKKDKDGYIYIVDRVKDMIIRGGFNVYPREVEEVLKTHHQIKEVGIIGVPNIKVGENVKALVVLESDARGELSESDIVEYCKDKLAHYKIPKIIEFVGEIPKTDIGKVSRRELREDEA